MPKVYMIDHSIEHGIPVIFLIDIKKMDYAKVGSSPGYHLTIDLPNGKKKEIYADEDSAFLTEEFALKAYDKILEKMKDYRSKMFFVNKLNPAIKVEVSNGGS